MELVVIFFAAILASLAGLQNIIAYFYITKNKINLVVGCLTLIIVLVFLVISCLIYFQHNTSGWPL